jgi:hypothetical protein
MRSRNISAHMAHFFSWFDAGADLQEPGGLVAEASRERRTAVLIDPFDYRRYANALASFRCRSTIASRSSQSTA